MRLQVNSHVNRRHHLGFPKFRHFGPTLRDVALTLGYHGAKEFRQRHAFPNGARHRCIQPSRHHLEKPQDIVTTRRVFAPNEGVAAPKFHHSFTLCSHEGIYFAGTYRNIFFKWVC